MQGLDDYLIQRKNDSGVAKLSIQDAVLPLEEYGNAHQKKILRFVLFRRITAVHTVFIALSHSKYLC